MATTSETWTVPSDYRLRRLRLEGESWEAIAEALAISPEAARVRAERIRARPPSPSLTLRDDPAREPLPAGHPRAWGVLTQGTWLDGTHYPTLPSLRSLA
jgi:hypothetical protein